MSNIHVLLLVCGCFVHARWTYSSPLVHRDEVNGRVPDTEDIFLDQNRQTENATQASKHDVVVWDGGKPEPKQPKKDDETRTKPSACHRENMLVNFADVGMADWVLVPASYNAYRCVGNCTLPLTVKQQVTNHALMELMMTRNMTDDVADHHGPCCTPTKLGSISVLIAKNNRVVLQEYTDMVVEECGCQ